VLLHLCASLLLLRNERVHIMLMMREVRAVGTGDLRRK
jgi:hypothetical protein